MGWIKKGGGGVGTGWTGTVTNFAALPAATGSGDVYLVQNSTGVLWNRRKGLYRDDGVGTWNRLSNAEFQVLDSESTFADDADNTKKMDFELSGITTGNTRTMTIPDADGTIIINEGAVTLNESGADVDFRVEGVGEANAFFVQGSDSNVGIGRDVPTEKLDIGGNLTFFSNLQNNSISFNNTDTTGATLVNGFAYNFVINSNGNDGIRIINGSTGSATIEFEAQNGRGYFDGNVSVQSITDRTQILDDIQEAIKAVQSIIPLPPEEYDVNDPDKQLDHDKLHPFIKSESGHRNMTASISCLAQSCQMLLDERKLLIDKINEIASVTGIDLYEDRWSE